MLCMHLSGKQQYFYYFYFLFLFIAQTRIWDTYGMRYYQTSQLLGQSQPSQALNFSSFISGYHHYSILYVPDYNLMTSEIVEPVLACLSCQMQPYWTFLKTVPWRDRKSSSEDSVPCCSCQYVGSRQHMVLMLLDINSSSFHYMQDSLQVTEIWPIVFHVFCILLFCSGTRPEKEHN